MDKITFDKLTESVTAINDEIDKKEYEIENLNKKKSDILKSMGYKDHGLGIWILK